MMLDVRYEHAPYVLVAILVVGHRHILGCIVSIILRIGLAFGLIKFQAKIKRDDSRRGSSTNKGEQDNATSASGGRIEIDGSDLDVQISLFGMMFGKAISSSSAIYRIQREMAGRVGGGEVTCTSDADANGHSGENDLLLESCRVKSITSVHIRRCNVGSIGLSLFSSVKRIVKGAGSTTVDAPAGRALCALTIGGIKMDSRIFVRLDSDVERRDVAIDVAMQVGCIQVGFVPLQLLKRLVSRSPIEERNTKADGTGCEARAGDPFASASSILSKVSPGFSLSGLCLSSAIEMPTRSPFSAFLTLRSFSIWGAANNRPAVNIAMQNLSSCLRRKGRDEAQDTSASIRSVQFLVCRGDDDCTGGGALKVKQRNGGITLESVVDLHSLESIVASANEAKAFLLAAKSLASCNGKKKGVKEGIARESKKAKDESIQKVIFGEVNVDLGLDVRIISAVPEDVVLDQNLTISADANVKCSLLHASEGVSAGVGNNNFSHCIQARTNKIAVAYSAEKQSGEEYLMRICGVSAQHVLDESNSITLFLDSLAVDANEAKMKLLARINRLAKSKPEATPYFIQRLILLSKKSPSKRSKGKAPPRIKVSCQEAQIFVEGYAHMDGLPVWPATYWISSNKTQLDITPKSPESDRDVIDAKSEEFHAAVTIHPHGVLPLHPDALQNSNDVHGENSQRPVTFNLVATMATMRASLGSTSHRKERDRIKTGPPSPHEEIAVYAEALVLNESFGHCRDCFSPPLGSAIITRLVDTSKASILVDATRFDAGPDYPRCLVRNIRIDTAGPSFRGSWSPVLQQYIGLIEQTTKATIKRYQDMFKTKPSSGPAVDVINVSLDITKSLLEIRLHMGHKSVLDLTAESLKVNVTNNPKGLWKKQSIQVEGRGLVGHINEFTQEVFAAEELRFRDVMRHATFDEVDSYNQKIDNDDIHSNSEVNAVVSDINGRPIMEEFGVHLGGSLRVSVPPVLHLGEVIDDFSNNAKTMFMALRQARLQRPQGKRLYQLMQITASVPFLDASLLEPMEDKQNFRNDEATPYFDMMRLTLEELALSVDRLTPPSCTQARLGHLDEDKKQRYYYGPSIQGGDTKFSVRHALCLLHPLTIATPLVRLDDFEYKGLFMMANLDPSTEGLVERPPYGYLFNCHHRTAQELSLSAETLLCSPSPCGCRYGVSVTSSSAPPKMFFDGAISLSGLDFSYGMCVLPSIPGLMDIIKRVQPPSSPNSAPAGPIGWWDNLRFLIHGNIRLAANRLCTRFLLDTPARYDWAIFLQCRNYVLDYETGLVTTSMNDATLTVPGLPYHATLNESNENNGDVRNGGLSAVLGLDSKGGRHSLLLVPRLSAKFGLHWIVKCPEKTSSTEHHAPYLMNDSLSTFLSDDDFALVAADKFYRFRSHGVNLDVSLELETNDHLNTWLALRVDVLPWLTHKLLSAIPPPSESEEDGPGPLPKIERVAINANAADIHLACWFDDEDDDDSKIGNPQIERNNDGICLMIPRLTADFVNTGDTHVQMEGLIQASLLDIDYASFYDTQPSSSYSLDDVEETIKACDHFVGTFAAANGFSDSPGAFDVVSGLDDEYASSSQDDEAAHVIFHRLQQWARNVSALDSVFVVDRIDVLSTPLHKLMANARRTSDRQSLVAQTRKSSSHSLSSTSIGRRPLWHETQTPWTVLVGGLKILWTLEIRDALLSLSQDLIFTLDYMKLALRTMPSKQKGSNEDDRSATNHNNVNSGGAALTDNVPTQATEHDGVEDNASQSSDDLDLDYLLGDSSLGHLIEEEKDNSSNLQKPRLSRNISVQEARQFSGNSNRSIGGGDDGAKATKNVSIPTLDVHLSNPQFQLHSDQTGGSVILAMRGAYIDGQRYLNLIDPDNLLNVASTSIDSLLQKTEFQYTLDRMEIYAIAPGVDVDAGLQWLDYHEDVDSGDGDTFGADKYSKGADDFSGDEDELPSILPSLSVRGGSIPEMQDAKLSSRRHFRPRFAQYDPKTFRKPPLLQLIMNRCTFDSRQVFHRSPHHLSSDELTAYIRRGYLEPLLESALDQVDLHIDEMSFMLDSHQYITTFDLIRNVLLEPPKVSSKRERRLFADTSEEPSEQKGELREVSDEAEKDESTASVEAIVEEWNTKFPKLKDGVHRQRKRIRQQLRNASQKLMAPLEQQHLLSRNTSNRKIKYTLGKLKWQIRSPDYFDEVTIDFTGFRGQHEFIADGAVISNISLEDVQVTTASPGPDAFAFYDPLVILACEVQGENPCTRCGKAFNRATNSARSCVHHAGTFAAGSDGIDFWTCCGSRLQDAPGCVARPHSGREKAAVVRIDTLPSPVKGLRLYKHIEINFYPNVQHTIVVQITKDLSNLFMAYFLGADDQSVDGEGDYGADSDDEEDDNSILEIPSDDILDDASSVSQSQTSSVALQAAQSHKATSSSRSRKSKRAALLGSHRSSDRDSGGRKRRSSRHQEGAVVVGAPPEIDASTPHPPQEIAFIKYWRIGNIDASLSVSGFAIDTIDLGILIPAYSKAYKCGRSNYLARKYISHLVHEIVRSAASSSMQKMKRKFSRHGKSRSSVEDQTSRRARTASGAAAAARAGSLEAAREDFLLGGGSIGGGGRKHPPSTRNNRRRLYTT